MIRNPEESADWLASTEAAHLLGLSHEDLRELVECERLPVLRSTNGTQRFRRSDVMRLLGMRINGDSDDCLDAVLAR